MLPVGCRKPLVEDPLHLLLYGVGKRPARLEDTPGGGRYCDISTPRRQCGAIIWRLDGDEVGKRPILSVELSGDSCDADGAFRTNKSQQLRKGPVLHGLIPEGG